MADQRGRPTAVQVQAQASRFLCLIAEGHDAKTAAKTAGLNPWRALDIVTESSFTDIVQAIREGVAA